MWCILALARMQHCNQHLVNKDPVAKSWLQQAGEGWAAGQAACQALSDYLCVCRNAGLCGQCCTDMPRTIDVEGERGCA